MSKKDGFAVKKKRSRKSRQDKTDSDSAASSGSIRASELPTTVDVLNGLLALSDDDARIVLAQLAGERSNVVETLTHAQEKTISGIKIKKPKSSTPKETTVEFGASHFFALEEEGVAKLTVLRMGALNVQTTVQYTTVNTTALAGKDFDSAAGTLVFQPGVNEQHVTIHIHQDEFWTNVLEFEVILKEEGLVNAKLGRYLYRTIVKIIDDDAFPANRFRKQLLLPDEHMVQRSNDADIQEALKSISMYALMVEYFLFNFRNPVVRCGSMKSFFTDVLRNCFLLFDLYLRTWIIDYVLDVTKTTGYWATTNRQRAILGYVSFLVLQEAIFHFLDFRKVYWKIGGGSRGLLQKSLFRKYMDYTEESRDAVQQSDLVMTMTRYIMQIVHEGYMNALNIFNLVLSFAAVIIFQFTAKTVFAEGESGLQPVILVATLSVPLIEYIFLHARNKVTLKMIREHDDSLDELADEVGRGVENYPLISDFQERPYFSDEFEDTVKDYNIRDINKNAVNKNNAAFADWVKLAFIASWWINGGMQAIENGLSLGLFLTNMKMLEVVGTSTGGIYKCIMEIQGTIPSLERIVLYLNMPTDVIDRKKQVDARIKSFHKFRQENNIGDGQDVPLDLMPIKLSNIRYRRGKLDTNIFWPDEVKIHQGRFVCFLGPRGEGKSTILKMLGSKIFPEPTEDGTSSVFVPAHLRVLHISNQPLFFKGTLIQNLRFGVKGNDEDGRMERVLELCKLFDVYEIIKAKDENTANDDIETEERKNWDEYFSLSNLHILNIVRAMIWNPEVLCIHKPTMALDEVNSRKLFGHLRDFVQLRGLCQDESERDRRRPRTCIATSSKMVGMEYADQFIFIDSNGIRELAKEDVADERAEYLIA